MGEKGGEKLKEKIFRKAKSLGLSIVSAVHPKAAISKDTKIGEGVVIGKGTTIKKNANIGRNARIGMNCIITGTVVPDETVTE